MGHRLSRIYTRTGDDGTTGLADGSRVSKDSARIEAMGAVDELNSLLAAVLLQPVGDDVDALLTDVQHALFDIGGELAIPGASTVTAEYVAALEQRLDALNADLPMLKEFILPGGGAAAVAAHVARAACRRAERRLLSLGREETVNAHSQRYLNRLSDLLFVLARALAVGDRGEVFWDPSRNKPDAA
jgi:cob(I)alamin adenosyltransferase